MRVRRRSRYKLTLFPCCLTILAVSISGMAYAQQAPVASGSGASEASSATDSSSSASLRSPFRLTSYFALTETFTDNVGLTKSEEARSDFITQISPSLSVSSGAGAIQGSLRAAFNGNFYGEDASRNKGYLTMNGSGRVEAWREHGYVDLSASISREAISAFAPRPSDSVTGTSNLSEVRNVMIAPYFVERFGDAGSAEVRYLFSETDGSGPNLKQTKNNALSFNIGDPAAFGNIGWYLAGSDSVMSTSGRRDLKQQSARLTGVLKLTPQFQLRLIGGIEGNNIRSVDTQRSSIYGAGADWSPSPTTKLTALWEDRYFGPGLQLSAEHRSPLHVVRMTYSRDVSSTSQSLAAFSSVGTYDLLMSLMQSSYPNALERDAFVRQYIATRGLPESVGISQAVLSNGLYLDRRLRLEMSLIGVRNTLVLSAFHSERSRFTEQSFSVLGGDFQNASSVREISGSATLSHQLTQKTSANVSLTVANSHRDASDATLNPSSRMRRISAGLVSTLAQRANGMLTLRNLRGEGASSYSENAAVASIVVTF